MPHQIEGAEWALNTLRANGLAYLAWHERTGKTLTALLTYENSSIVKRVLIITKKKAIKGWKDTLDNWRHFTHFDVINYESAHKIAGNYDAIILDESHHAISGIGRPSNTWKVVRRLTKGKPILFLSATPYAEHVGLLYHQLAMSDWSPFRKYKNFYRFYDVYGIPNMVRTNYGLLDRRNKYKTEEVLSQVEHLFNFKTREGVGMIHEPTAQVVTIPLQAYTITLMEEWVEYRIITLDGEEILNDSDMKGRTVHYQLEGGTLKVNASKSIFLEHCEKIDYIKSNYNLESIAIMAHFVKERELLAKHIPEARILSSDGDAEGVDLSDYDKLIVYSMSDKTSKYTQRLARQANHNRQDPIEVDILVADHPAIGKAIYESVAVKKENFVKSSYERAIRGKK